MKNFLIYLLLLMSAVACSEVDPVIDDEDDKGAEVVKPDDEPDDETGDETVMIYGVKVYDESGDNAGGVAHYVYDYDDSGRVTTIVDAASDEMIMQYRYEDNLVRVGGIIGEYIVELDDKGRIHETSVAGEDMTLKWSYGMNGYVNGVTASPETWSCRIVNRMGNFTEVPSLGDGELTYISYTDHLSRYSIDLWNNPVFGFNENILCYTFGVRAKGVISRNLPSSYKYYGDEWRFSYTFDDEGNVSVMEMSCNDELVRTVYFDCGDGFPGDMPSDEESKEDDLKLVKSLITTDYDGYTHLYFANFDYDSKGRITKVTTNWHTDRIGYTTVFYYLYDDSIKKMSCFYDSFNGADYEGTTDVAVCYFNDWGMLERCVDDDVEYVYVYLNGKISEIFRKVDDSFWQQTYYSWIHGNCCAEEYTDSTGYYDYIETDVEYENVINKCNVDFYSFCDYAYEEIRHYSTQFFFDRNTFNAFYGANLIKSTYGNEIEYEFDKEGYPVKMILYADGELYEEMTIEYYE